MDGIIELAIAVGRLEQRVRELEEKLEKKEEASPPPPVVTPSFGEEDKMTADKLLQQGIDNIMGYQWPPAKEVDDG